MNRRALDKLPEGGAWLLVELADDDEQVLTERIDRLVDDLGGDESARGLQVLCDRQDQADLWAFREAGLGATAHPPEGRDTWPGWEDSAVAPERLGDYLHDLLDTYSLTQSASLYGHFGHGCVHLRIPFDLRSEEGVAQYRAYLGDAADLVTRYGGSLCGEHGDGQVRGQLLGKMFPGSLLTAFATVKSLLDPDDRLNPGKTVVAYPPEAYLRVGPHYPAWEPEVAFGYPEDGAPSPRRPCAASAWASAAAPSAKGQSCAPATR